MKLFPILLAAFCSTALFLPSTDAKSRQKRYWLWYNGYADTNLGFIYAIPFNTFLPGLGPIARSFQNSENSEPFPDFEIQPQYQEEIQKVLGVFYYLGIKEFGCHERLICYLSSEPETFSPVSEIILREIGEEYGPIIKSSKSLIWRYNKALRTGFLSTLRQCEEVYDKCPLNEKKILNMPVLKAWQFLASHVGIHLL